LENLDTGSDELINEWVEKPLVKVIPHISEQIKEALLTLKRPSHQIIFA
jgi:hypothetical protein